MFKKYMYDLIAILMSFNISKAIAFAYSAM